MAHTSEHISVRRNGSARAALKARAGDVLEDFSSLRKDMKKLARAANKAARVEVEHAGATLSSARSVIGEKARDRLEQARERIETVSGRVSDQVRERPGAAIGLSLGAGLVLGMLLSPRR